MVPLAEKPRYRDMKDLKFKTSSGKVDVLSERLDKAGLPSLKPYEPPVSQGEGKFRIAFGRCPVHTQGHTVNNPMLNELMPENVLWLNKSVGEKMKIRDGEEVEISSGGHSERFLK
jgi:thiosulfate reductase/polysulfide reductase chain A